MTSPACTVRDGGGSAQSTTSAYATATPGNTVTIALADATGVSTWAISCVYADETTVPATITSGLTINSALKTATFTAPTAGRAMIFRSVVNGGVDASGVNAALTTQFKVATLTNNRCVGAANETTEHSATYGSTGLINALIRDAAEYLAGTVVATTVDWTPGSISTYRTKSTLATVQTTDATVTTLASYAAPDARLVDYFATVTAYRPSNGDSYRIDLSGTYKRFGGGVPTLVGSNTSVNAKSDAGASGWLAAFDVSSNDVRVRVTGQAAATINWSCELRAQERS